MVIASVALRFVCDVDVDVDAAVTKTLRRMGHDAWTAWQGAMSEAGDDELAVCTAEKNAIIVALDHEFSARRRKFVTTRNI